MPIHSLENSDRVRSDFSKQVLLQAGYERAGSGDLRRQQGVALLVSIMMLTIMGLIGLGSMELATRD